MRRPHLHLPRHRRLALAMTTLTLPVASCGGAATGPGGSPPATPAGTPTTQLPPVPTQTQPGPAERVLHTQVNGHPVWIHFSDPMRAPNGRDPTIIRDLVRLIDATPGGEQIHGAIPFLDLPEVSRALLRAQQRGVDVEVVFDSNVAKTPGPALDLAKRLAHEKFCQGGCVSDHGFILHSKLVVFSRTADPDGVMHRQVSWFGTANPHLYSSEQTFNNTITTYGDRQVYAHLAGYFDDLWHERHFAGNDYYDEATHRGFAETDLATFYESPEQQTDLVLDAFGRFQACPGSRVAVAEYELLDTRIDIARRLVGMKRDGADVTVVVGLDQNGRPQIGPRSWALLKAAGIPVRANYIHDKITVYSGRYPGDPSMQYRVLTGSHNWSSNALHNNDELLARLVNDKGIYDAYLAHYGDIWSTAVPVT
jgi:phosphatidylserine/phosphatidylglycerophosphate/cardiolipin synthase-like enzyme